MKKVFVDSQYWIAIVKPEDPWKNAANQAKTSLGHAILFTTDEVLSEFLATLSKCGPCMRAAAVKMVRAIMENTNVRVIQQTRDGFLKGLARYDNRKDKQYSLTDCISMNVMESNSLTEALTNDHHFEQEGFSVLMQKSS
jgi:uncharacterized protein